MFTPTGNCDGQITECELLKMIIDAYVFRVNKQLYFQFHYSCSFDSLVNMASKTLTCWLDECVKAIRQVESGGGGGGGGKLQKSRGRVWCGSYIIPSNIEMWQTV